ncbi:hypothetical protein ACFLQ2_05345 [archaeon]
MGGLKERHERLKTGITNIGGDVNAKATVTLDIDNNKVVHNVELQGDFARFLTENTGQRDDITNKLADAVKGDSKLVVKTTWDKKKKSLHFSYPIDWKALADQM